MPGEAALDRRLFEAYAGLEGRDLIATILRDFAGRAAVVSSFGAESAVLLHMVASVDPATPVLFLDTQKHFWETLAYRAMLIDRLGLTGVRSLTPSPEDLAAADPTGTLHRSDADRCCYLRKTRPLRHALAEVDAVISGRKRYHGAERASLDFLSLDGDRLKVEPLAGFSALDISGYMAAHALPAHPLTALGYYSVGCEPCTQPGGDPADPRAGRWAGAPKTECGIHWTRNGQPFARGDLQ